MERIQRLLFAALVGFTSTKTYNTLNLVSHLKMQHCVVYREYEKQKSLEAQKDQSMTLAKAKQLILTEQTNESMGLLTMLECIVSIGKSEK